MDIYTLLLAVLPAITVAVICYFSIQSMVSKELLKQKYALLKSTQKDTLPLKLQAYERLTLLLERISLDKLLVRIPPTNESKEDYKNLLMATIAQEFEHNLTQQIYVSDECWKTIQTAKNTIISQLHGLYGQQEINNAITYRNEGIKKYSISNSVTQIAQTFIRSEVSLMFHN